MKRHYPKDNDAVEVWLRTYRDLLAEEEAEAFDAVQELIDDYREHADSGEHLQAWKGAQ